MLFLEFKVYALFTMCLCESFLFASDLLVLQRTINGESSATVSAAGKYVLLSSELQHVSRIFLCGPVNLHL